LRTRMIHAGLGFRRRQASLAACKNDVAPRSESRKSFTSGK
jgi:hypothetical protein